MVGQCLGTLTAACMLGTDMPRGLLLLELAEGADPDNPATRDRLRRALSAANAQQPHYSAVLPGHALLLPPGALPKTVKGTVQRHKCCACFATEVEQVWSGEYTGVTLLDEAADELEYDSLSLTKQAAGKKGGGGDGGRRPFDFLSGGRFFAALWVVCVHATLPTLVKDLRLETVRYTGAEAPACMDWCFKEGNRTFADGTIGWELACGERECAACPICPTDLDLYASEQSADRLAENGLDPA
jgi:hypothetical protein